MSVSRLGVSKTTSSDYHMLLIALKLQLAALATVAGINTEEITSPEVKSTLTKLEAIQKDSAGGQGKTDINQASTEAIKAIAALSDKGDKDALYAMALWSRIGILSGATSQQLLDWYTKAADAGQVTAKAELGSLYISNFPQDVDKVTKGVKYIQEAEAAGNKGARRALAQLTLVGVPAAKLDRNIQTALSLYEKGRADGDGESTFSLSQIYTLGIQEKNGDEAPKPLLPKEEAKGLALLEESVKQGFPPAMSQLAERLLTGEGVKADPARALKILNDASAKGSAPAERQLAMIYEQGLGGETKDIKKAAEHYAAAARGNDGVAQLWLGNAAQNGVLTDAGAAKVKDAGADKKPELKNEDVLIAPNPATALNFYRLAAQNNVPQAIYYVGLFYENGAVVDKDPIKAFSLVQRAAQASIPVAQYKLGTYYQNGVGVAQDVVAAAGWYQRAAESGLPQAKLVYGAMLEGGVGVPRSLLAAQAQYQEAAKLGLPQAMVSLASLSFRGGDGIKSSKENAWAYATLAVEATKSDPKAVEFLKEIEGKMNDKEKSDAKNILATIKAGNAAAPAPAPTTPAATPDKPATGTKKKK
ncbi:MAG: hypothetical protein JWO08_2603 [Verrucomicrobiaceae bacterium]|nr:hypothetical protein [Verrucomicrobiaceae bacterium]